MFTVKCLKFPIYFFQKNSLSPINILYSLRTYIFAMFFPKKTLQNTPKLYIVPLRSSKTLSSLIEILLGKVCHLLYLLKICCVLKKRQTQIEVSWTQVPVKKEKFNFFLFKEKQKTFTQPQVNTFFSLKRYSNAQKNIFLFSFLSSQAYGTKEKQIRCCHKIKYKFQDK